MLNVLKLLFTVWLTIYTYNYMDDLDYKITHERYDGVCLKLLNDEWNKLGKDEYTKKYPNERKAQWKCSQDDATLRFLNWFGF